MRELYVKRGEERYLDGVCALFHEAFNLSVDDIQASIDRPTKHVFGRLEDDRLVSAALVNLIDSSAQLPYLATFENMRGQKRGSQLLSAIESECKRRGANQMSLYCSDTDRHNFYLGLGYEQRGTDMFLKSL